MIFYKRETVLFHHFFSFTTVTNTFIYEKELFLPALLFTVHFTEVAQMKADDVKTFTLNNGMKFLVVEDNSIPNANMYLFYRVGSRNEHQESPGFLIFLST